MVRFKEIIQQAQKEICQYSENLHNANVLREKAFKGYVFIAVFESSNPTLQDYLKETEVPFPIVGDPSLELYKKYGVKRSFWRMVGSMFDKKTKHNLKEGKVLVKGKNLKRDGNMSRIPADFLIDESGQIVMAYNGKNISDHLPLETILNQ